MPAEIYMFNDGDDNEQSTVYINAIQFRDVAMTDEEVAALGGPTADGPPLTGAGVATCVPLGVSAPELLASDLVTGPYAVQVNAVVNTTAKTITVAAPNTKTRFYRVRSGSALKVKTVKVQGANIVFTYE